MGNKVDFCFICCFFMFIYHADGFADGIAKEMGRPMNDFFLLVLYTYMSILNIVR